MQQLKFHHTAKWYMHKPEPVLENEGHKILCELEILIDHRIPARRPNLVRVNKYLYIKKEDLSKTSSSDFVATADHRLRIKENEKVTSTLTLPVNSPKFPKKIYGK